MRTAITGANNFGIKTVRLFIKGGKINLDTYDANGKRWRFSTGMSDTKHNRLVVERQKFSLAIAHLEANQPSNADTKFDELALEALRSTKDERSVEVQDDYESIYERLIKPLLGMMAIGAIKAKHIEELKRKLIARGMSKSRFNKHWTTLNLIFAYLFKNELIDKNPMSLVKRASKSFKETEDDRDKYYSLEESKAIMDNATGWFQAFITTLLMTGCRSSEISGLTWDRIDFEKGQITIARSTKKRVLKCTKTGKTRVVDMPTPLVEILRQHYENRISDKFVFPSPRSGLPFYASNMIIKTYLKPLLKELDIPYKTLYATRHTYASLLIENNVPITYVQKMLGHANLSTTMLYIKNTLMDTKAMLPKIDNLYSA